MSSLRFLGIVGSLRKGSLNRALLRAIGETLPEGATLTIYDGLGAMPHFNAELSEPEAVTTFKRAIADADGVIFAVPEYNYSVPGVLKNSIDWASRPPATSPLRGKPVAITSASIGISGGMRAQYHLRQIFVYTDTPVMAQPEVILPKAQDRFDGDGRLIDPSTRQWLEKFGAAMVAWTQRFAPTK